MDEIWHAAKGVLANVAPTLATAVGGPFAGMAARAITGALIGDESDNIDDAMRAIQDAKPEQLLALQQSEQKFKLEMEALNVDLERIHASDRDSARKRQVATKDKMPGYIASAALFGFFSILFAMIFMELPPASEAPLNVMLGALAALVSSIANYYFGSSASSSRKNEIMNAMINGNAGSNSNG